MNKSICHQCGNVFIQNVVRKSHKCKCGCRRSSFISPRDGETAQAATQRRWKQIVADYQIYAGADAEILAIRANQRGT